MCFIHSSRISKGKLHQLVAYFEPLAVFCFSDDDFFRDRRIVSEFCSNKLIRSTSRQNWEECEKILEVWQNVLKFVNLKVFESVGANTLAEYDKNSKKWLNIPFYI